MAVTLPALAPIQETPSEDKAAAYRAEMDRIVSKMIWEQMEKLLHGGAANPERAHTEYDILAKK